MLINPSTLLAPKFDKMAVFGTNLMIQYSQLMICWCVMAGQLIKTTKNTVCQVALWLGICVNDAHSTMIFQSVGVFGEPVFSQIAPIGKPSTAIKVHYFSTPKNHQNTQACHYLKTNLNTLQSGGVIYEIGENGRQTKLTPDLIQQKIHHIQAAIDSHCRN